MSGLPKVTILSLGGTIASAPAGDDAKASPALSASAISASVPELTDLAELETRDLAMLPSIDVSFELAMAVADASRAAEQDGSAGVVVTQGTDTIEEMAFCLDLLYAGDMPVAVTGAMRHAGLVGNDGPANLLDAVRTVISPSARGLGSLVVLNDEIHSARAVHKAHTSSPAAFQSPSVGPIGWIVEGVPHLRDRPFARVAITPPAGSAVIRPPLVKMAFDDDGWWIPRVSEMGARGLVIEAMGGGHIPGRLCTRIAEIAARIPVLLTTRTGGGEVLQSTYGGFPGSETMLIDAGLIPAGSLDSLKARVLLALLLTDGADRERIASVITSIGSPARTA